MKQLTTEVECRAPILDVLKLGPRSAGDIARKMMGAGLLANEEWSYIIVREALHGLHRDGLVESAGNGKAIHWRLPKKGSAP